MDWLGAGLALAGGLLGSDSGDQTQTSERKMDPRMDRYVYGPDGQSGLLGSAFNLMQNQMQTGGLNPTQQAGLEMQRQFLMSPQYQQGFSNMLGMGQSLMGGGVAGNPFMGSGGQTFGGFQQPSSFAYNTQGVPQSLMDAATKPMQFNPSPSMVPQMNQPLSAMNSPRALQSGMDRSGNGSMGAGGRVGGSLGQGISSDTISSALAAMAASENPALRAVAPALALALGVSGTAAADGQIDGISDSFGALGNIAGMSVPGIGSYSDANGNVMSISTPGLIAAADRAMFGGGFGRGNDNDNGGSGAGTSRGFGNGNSGMGD